MVIIALLTGILTFLNYALWVQTDLSWPWQVISLAAQSSFVLATIFAAINYRGKRSRPSYDLAGYNIWTFRYALIMVSAFGNLSVLIILLLHATGLLDQL